MGVTMSGMIDTRAAQTMRTSLGMVAENSRVCLLVKVRTLPSTSRGHDEPSDYCSIRQERYNFLQIVSETMVK